jgi:hypothetical protein
MNNRLNKKNTKVPNPVWRLLGCGLFAFAVSLPASAADVAAKGKTQALPDTATAGEPLKTDHDYSFSEMVSESLVGDVYADPSKWQALSFGNLLSKGWDKPWASPPTGGGGAPRQGWFNAYDGVFYRLGIATFGWQHGPGNYTDGYSGGLTLYTPLNQRFEFQTDIPLVSNRDGHDHSQTNFGDFQITPRFLLAESKELTQTLNVTFRTPTGSRFNGNGVASISPTYNFWANYWKGLVVRGGFGLTIPYSGNIAGSGARTTFNANLAVGYYFTPHDFTPIGDMVWYVSTNLSQALDERGSSSTSVFSVGPGFRTHMGDNWYLLGAVDVPVTTPKPYDYQVFGGIMKVY